jgi:glyoxylase-like metal-dependent hydrolase (beta-lactamase superfamily II)
MRRIKKRYLIIGVPLALIVVAIGIAVGVLMFAGLPLHDGAKLGYGRITVITDRFGPITIGAYLFELAGGGYGLVDTGIDPKATAIRKVLERREAMADDIQAIFLTHGHNDHVSGALSFPKAKVYVLQPDVAMVEQRGIAVARALVDGDRIDVDGTTVDVFAVPGHTLGSAAYLVYGVLFLGDSAAAAYNGLVAPNDFAFTANAEQNDRSLRELVTRLRARASEIQTVAFGHQGSVQGMRPLLDWALAH